jgi:hypothetical protein
MAGTVTELELLPAAIVNGTLAKSVPLALLERVLKVRLVKPLEHQVDHGDVDESFAGFS